MAKTRILYIAALLLLLFSCSRTTLSLKKNTWATRTYHNTVSKYNIYFNGNEAYQEGLQKIEEKNQNDYSQVLSIFEDVDHTTYSISADDMDYAIEKANKIIQLHSIKVKPDYNSKKIRDPEYREWRNQEEFNKMIDDAYVMLGKAHFYKGEFMEAIGVFSYVALKYPGQDVWYLAHLWIARAYAEMGWLYEAENMLNLVNDENLPFQYEKFYNIVSADFHIKRGEYQQAVPFIKSALEEHFKKEKRQRYEYILAQIYQEAGRDQEAYEMYKKVVRSIPNYEMEFNARIRMTEVMEDDDTHKAIRKLKKMLKDPKNIEYKGEIYYALGNVYTTINDKEQAVDSYRLSMEFSEGLQRGVTAKTIAELYWNKQDYRKAAPYYAIASEALPEDYPQAYEIAFRADNLGELEGYYNIMGEQDREFLLSQMSESEKKAFLKEEEKETAREDKIQKLIAEAKGEAAKEEVLQADRNVKKGDWYFYNPDLVEKGKEEFRNQWGDRQLKDNWRRSMAMDFSNPDELLADENRVEDVAEEQDSTLSEVDIAREDSIAQAVEAQKLAAEHLQKALSDKAVVDSYFNLAALYQYDIENYNKAIETYASLEAQYPGNPHSPDSYFAVYNAAMENGEPDKAEEAKRRLLSDYPESNYALILSDPNAKEILLQDKEDYNALYEKTFALFQKGKNYEVLDNTDKLKHNFRDTTLEAKVLLMEALATAKVDARADIKPQLLAIKEGYPQDEEVHKQVDIILSQLQQGKKMTTGGSAANTLSKRRNKEAEIQRQKLLEEQQYRYEPEARHYMVMIMPDSSLINRNHLQYDIARFNFNKYMTMDFDLSFGKLNENTSLMIVNGFSNEEEGKWYQRELLSTNLPEKYSAIKKWYVISEENFRLLLMLQTFEEYDVFNNKH